MKPQLHGIIFKSTRTVTNDSGSFLPKQSTTEGSASENKAHERKASLEMSSLHNPRYGRKQAAAYLGVKPQTLGVWASTNRYNLPYVKIGRLVQYYKSDLDAFLEERRIACGKGEDE